MSSFSEEVTKTWIKKKGVLLKYKPKSSKFSFVVCFCIALSLLLGFLAGVMVAGFALNENYSSVYASLLKELDDTKSCILREKNQLETLRKAQEERIKIMNQVAQANAFFDPLKKTHQVHEQAIFSVFGHAVELLQKNDKKSACHELYNLVNLDGYNGEWKTKALYLLNKNCP